VKYLIEQGYEKETEGKIYHLLNDAVSAIQNSPANNQLILIMDAKHLKYAKVAHLPSKF